MMPLDAPVPIGCPFSGGSRFADPLARPPGYLRRIAAVDREVDETKRNLLKLAAVAGVLGVGAGGAVGGALKYVQPPIVGASSYPKTQLLDVDGKPLTVNRVAGTQSSPSAPFTGGEYNVTTADDIVFDYPLSNEPNFFLNLYPADGNPPSATNPGAMNVPGGIGPNGSIVAFSAVCQHLGCIVPSISYYPPKPTGSGSWQGTCPQSFTTAKFPNASLIFYIHCSCHGSTYDPTNGAANLTGPAVIPLPQVSLATEPVPGSSPTDYYIFAVGETGAPVKGHITTLEGGYSVGTSAQLGKDTPVILCNIG